MLKLRNLQVKNPVRVPDQLDIYPRHVDTQLLKTGEVIDHDWTKELIFKPLEARCKYIFSNQYLFLHFYDKNKFGWRLMSISGSYVFNKTKINWDDFFLVCTEESSKIFRLNIRLIDRHIYMPQFTFVVCYLFMQDAENRCFTSKYSVDVPYFENETQFEIKFLDHFHADERIVRLYNFGFKMMHPDLSEYDKCLLRKIHQHSWKKSNDDGKNHSYIQMLKYALNIEDLTKQDELKCYSLRDVRLRSIDSKYRYGFFIPMENIPPNYGEMSLCLVPMKKFNGFNINNTNDCIFAQIEKIHQNRFVHFVKKLGFVRKGVRRRLNLYQTYFIRFVPNRITYRACFQALESIAENFLSEYFANFLVAPKKQCMPISYLEKLQEKFECFNQQIAANDEQMAAIRNIVNCMAFPFPYVVFGPPGTGKTSMLVECVAQILKMKPTSRIMITAQSNSACDEIGMRLLKYISLTKIYRFYSSSLLKSENGETSSMLWSTSNLRNKFNQYPTKEEFEHFQVIISTLMSSSRIAQMDINDRHFDYLFIDECAAAPEPESLVPILGLATDIQEITAQIVLLGDHKQLGPVIGSDLASKLGLSESLMERLMKKPRYLPNPEYDQRYVTQLLDNYRSHPAILQFSNVQFYNSKLRARIAEPERSFAAKWQFLSNHKFPILFHCNKSPSEVTEKETSTFNDGEISLVVFYVNLLLIYGIDGNKIAQQDIGIVSPYKAQLNKLREALEQVKDIEIGTAEYYQGREKKIIIISTVKSKDKVGFLKSEKRMNVCITRAKSLLIVIGNPETLMQNDLWNSFIHFCKVNGAFRGESFSLKELTDDEKRIMKKLNNYAAPLTVARSPDYLQVVKIRTNERLKALEEQLAKLRLL